MLSLDEIILVVDGKPSGIDNYSLQPLGVSTDSRSIQQGEIFVALKGLNFDGHDYIEQAFINGAIAAIVSEDVSLPRTIKVSDTLESLGTIAHAWRRKLDIPTIVISGTNGKTTVKNILKALLSVRFSTYANPGNRNNLIGLPLSILEIDETHEIGVLEAGINNKGELAQLAEIAEPTHGILTNIGPGHLEGLGSLEEVFEAKWELASSIKKSEGVLYLNADYPQFVSRADKEGISHRTFGLQADAQFKPNDVLYTIDGSTFKLQGQHFSLPLLGAGNLSNAVAAIAVAAGEFGISLPESAGIIADIKPEKWRLEHRIVGDVHLLIDCYNANPVSMKESLGLLTLFPPPRISVLGAMLELGEESENFHHQILELARDTSDLVIITGPYSELYPQHEGVLFIPEKKKAAEELHKRLVSGATVLIKGSRSCGLEDVVSQIWDQS